MSIRPSPAKLQIASMGGRRLLDAAEPQVDGIGWPATRFGDGALIGYAHGASGIATALTGLFRATGDIAYRSAAEMRYNMSEACSMSRRADGPTDDRSQAMTNRCPTTTTDHYAAWCRGAGGIGLSRLQMLGALEDADMEKEIDAAVAETLAHGFGQSHCLCHGDLGSLEFLHQASAIAEWSVLQRET